MIRKNIVLPGVRRNCIHPFPILAPIQIEAAELVVTLLEGAGIEYVFGVPGGAVEPLYNALARSARRGGPRTVTARHETGAAFKADGYARETRKLGVCIATSGPGATNMITGVACAYANGVPLLAITGQPALPIFGKGALQESSCTGIDIVGMFAHCTRYNSLVSHIEQVETKVVGAILHSLRKPNGPSHLSFPVDVLRGLVPGLPAGHNLPALVRERPSPVDDRSVAALDEEMKAASSIVFLIGDGAVEAVDSIMDLARLTGALFITTPDAKGSDQPVSRSLSRGFRPRAGTSAPRTPSRRNPASWSPSVPASANSRAPASGANASSTAASLTWMNPRRELDPIPDGENCMCMAAYAPSAKGWSPSCRTLPGDSIRGTQSIAAASPQLRYLPAIAGAVPFRSPRPSNRSV